jgi:hypothetical protein
MELQTLIVTYVKPRKLNQKAVNVELLELRF